jgi:hypothetical protein
MPSLKLRLDRKVTAHHPLTHGTSLTPHIRPPPGFWFTPATSNHPPKSPLLPSLTTEIDNLVDR